MECKWEDFVESLKQRLSIMSSLVDPRTGKSLRRMNKQIIQAAITAILYEIEQIPEDQDLRQGLQRTPERVYNAFKELYSGYDMDPSEILSTTFGGEEDPTLEEYGQMVIVRKIPFYSQCEHHMVPFFGTVDIGYIPDSRVVGLSKLARLVECFGRRLQVQERMTQQIVKAMEYHLKPMGAIAVVEATHLCMCSRGIKKPGSETITSAITGVFRDPMERAREEFLVLTGRR